MSLSLVTGKNKRDNSKEMKKQQSLSQLPEQKAILPTKSDISVESASHNQPEQVVATGLLVWSQNFSDLGGMAMIDNYLVPYDPIPNFDGKSSDKLLPGSNSIIKINRSSNLSNQSNDQSSLLATDFCDFIFPVLIGSPGNIPLDQSWLKQITTIMSPGCYLVSARPKTPTLWLPSDLRFKVNIYRTNINVQMTRLDSNLYFIMHSINKNDVNLNVNAYVDYIDDLDSIKGHFFPHRISPNMSMVMSKIQRKVYERIRQAPKTKTHLQKYVERIIREPSEDSISPLRTKSDSEIKRVLKRHVDLYHIYSEILLKDISKLKETFVTAQAKDDQHFYSERFNFFLSQDSFGIILDQNWLFDRVQWKISRDYDEKPSTFIRLVRPGAYVAIEGTPRYCNLADSSHTYLTRAMFQCRFTCFPMFIVQEGIKTFDAYYCNDGLDFTFFDSIPFDDQIYVDWYQIQTDLKMDEQTRIYKGHIMYWNELYDILPNLPLFQMTFDPEFSSDIKLPCMEDDITRPFRPLIVFTLQQVLYNYIDALNSKLEITWNLHLRVDNSHIPETLHNKSFDRWTNPAYMYMKSFNCAYTWSQKDKDSEINEKMVCDLIQSTNEASELDFAKIFWSPKMYYQYFALYHDRLLPYQNSIKNWLLKETRKVKRNVIVRPTTLTDKLLYRNGFYEQKIQLFLKERLNNPKTFLNIKVKKSVKTKQETKLSVTKNKIISTIVSMCKSDVKLSMDLESNTNKIERSKSIAKKSSNENFKNVTIKSPGLVFKRSPIKLSTRKFSINKPHQIEQSVNDFFQSEVLPNKSRTKQSVLKNKIINKTSKSKFVKEKENKFKQFCLKLETDSKRIFNSVMDKSLKQSTIRNSKTNQELSGKSKSKSKSKLIKVPIKYSDQNPNKSFTKQKSQNQKVNKNN